MSNRAASYIAIKEYRKALDDCKAAIRINPDFARVYKRLFKAHLALGNIQDAKEAFDQAVTLDPNDATNKKDKESLDTVIHQQSMIEKFNSEADQDYQRAVGYCDSILNNCPASVFHICLKCENLLKAYKLKEAQDFSQELMKRPDTCNVPNIMSWCGRIQIYAGSDVVGTKLLKESLTRDPDLKESMKAIKMIKVATQMKEEAGADFKAEKLEDAVAKFDKCLELDPFNLTYNATILLNKSIALNKLKKNDLALKALNLCLKMKPNYAKALVKRGEIHQANGDWEEAVSDYGEANQIDPAGFGVGQKLKYAQQNAKKARKKDYYGILGVAKDASDNDIKKAYRKMARDWHPDRHSQADEETKTKAEKKFKEINEAMAILSDPQKRKQHDMGMSADDM